MSTEALRIVPTCGNGIFWSNRILPGLLAL